MTFYYEFTACICRYRLEISCYKNNRDSYQNYDYQTSYTEYLKKFVPLVFLVLVCPCSIMVVLPFLFLMGEKYNYL